MDYHQTLDYLFNALPMFQRVGASAFRKDLFNTLKLCDHLGNPQDRFPSVHVAGTNGKGSSSHAICAVLMAAGYKVGLYTSPHLKSFTERIKINGIEIDENSVVDFVSANKPVLDDLKPSFFEMTVAMAFWYFAKEQVDIAVVEVGMGGRLDSTNVITPKLSLITNIGWDHMQFLGNTLPDIAREKAGIIKNQVPVVISRKQPEITAVFDAVAKEQQAPIFYAEDLVQLIPVAAGSRQTHVVISGDVQWPLNFDLKGDYQRFNLPGIVFSLMLLQQQGWNISISHMQQGLSQVATMTGLKGRWQVLGREPLILCDTGHNEDGIKEVFNQIQKQRYEKLWVVLGMVQDKDISHVLEYLPTSAYFFFCEAKIPRAMPAAQLETLAKNKGLVGEVVQDVNEAIQTAIGRAGDKDMIFIGGSTFVVAEIDNL
jgi:dihydrofolate synthase / folylpolyglutamate synthase